MGVRGDEHDIGDAIGLEPIADGLSRGSHWARPKSRLTMASFVDSSAKHDGAGFERIELASGCRIVSGRVTPHRIADRRRNVRRCGTVLALGRRQKWPNQRKAGPTQPSAYSESSVRPVEMLINPAVQL